MTNKILAALISIIFLRSAFADNAFCRPSQIEYRIGIQKSLRYVVEQAPKIIRLSRMTGYLHLSILPEDFHFISDTKYTSEQVIRVHYAHLTDDFGAITDLYKLSHTTSPKCDNYDQTKVEETLNIPSFTADEILSQMALVALDQFTAQIESFPRNNHSGSHSLKIHVPTVCANDALLYNVNLQRMHTVAGRTVSRIFRYVIRANTKEVVLASSSPGWWLNTSCD